MQTFQQERGGYHEDPDHQWPRPSKADEQCDAKVAEEVVNLPAKRRAGCPFFRPEGSDHEQNQDGPAANFCARSKPRFHIGAYGKYLALFPHTVPLVIRRAVPWAQSANTGLLCYRPDSLLGISIVMDENF
ncbi:MAG: hypothetical protein WBQ55_18775 [Xanthobacteraceae bacterium]